MTCRETTCLAKRSRPSYSRSSACGAGREKNFGSRWEVIARHSLALVRVAPASCECGVDCRHCPDPGVRTRMYARFPALRYLVPGYSCSAAAPVSLPVLRPAPAGGRVLSKPGLLLLRG